MPERRQDQLDPRLRPSALVALAVTTAVAALVTWFATQLATGAQQNLRAAPVVSLAVESDPTRVNGFAGEPRAVVVPGDGVPAGDPGPACGEIYPWARSIGGADADTTRLHVLVRGEDTGTVVVERITAVVDEREPPVDGHRLSCEPEGELESRDLVVDLDAPVPSAIAPQGADGFTLAPGEVEAFLVRASTDQALVRWHLVVEVLAGDERERIRVDDGGRPFATTATGTTRPGGSWRWDPGGRRWCRADCVGADAVPPGTELVAGSPE